VVPQLPADPPHRRLADLSRPDALRASPIAVNQRGFGILEIVLVVAVVAVAGYLLLQYVNSTARTADMLERERPIDRTRLAAALDGETARSRKLEATNREIAERLDTAMASIQSVLDTHE